MIYLTTSVINRELIKDGIGVDLDILCDITCDLLHGTPIDISAKNQSTGEDLALCQIEEERIFEQIIQENY